MSHPPLFQKEDNTGSNIVNFPAHSALVQSLLVLDRSDGLAKSHGLLAFFTWLLTIATTCSVYTKMLPQAHPSSINEPMTSTYLEWDGEEGSLQEGAAIRRCLQIWILEVKGPSPYTEPTACRSGKYAMWDISPSSECRR